METKQIHDDAGVSAAGDVAYIKAIVDEEHVEVEANGHARVVIHGCKDAEGETVKIEPGDRVMLDHTNTITVRVLEKDNADRFNLIEQQNVTWDQIAGLGDVKESLVEALELPYQHPDIFRHYNKKPPKGVLLYGPPGCGKAQPFSSTVWTPGGPTKMGNIQIGDVVSTPDGKTAEVLEIHPQGVVDIYRMYFTDDSWADCTLDHLWKVEAQSGRKGGIMTTKDLLVRLHDNDGKRIYSIPQTKPADFEKRDHLVHPYVLGLLIAEGCFRGSSVSVTICEKEILDRFVRRLPANYSLKPKEEGSCDYYVTRDDREGLPVLTQEIRRLGLLGKASEEKFIPKEYLYDSVENRLELLRGLMDGDGTVSKEGHVSYSTASCRLAEDVKTLVHSWGGTCSVSFKEVWYTHNGVKQKGQDAFVCNISVIEGKEIFTLGYKIERCVERTKYFPKRMIDRIELVRQEEAQCILLDHPDHLYLTDNFVVTHNTLCAKAAANSMARIHGKENYQSGFIYVKGPELLSKWVGQSEAEIRQLFVRGREHYKKHGYPALLFIDEADAILPMRGSGKSSDVENTIVPMFLSEMDGLEEAHLMVLLATNQPKRLDPAVTREGRVDRKVRVGRPTAKNAHEYFALHMKGIPVGEGMEAEELSALTIRDLFSDKRGLYNVQYKKQTHLFKLGDAVSGSMIATIVDHATSQAMKRDLHANTKTGVVHTDFQDAVNGIFKHHVELNPTFDLEEFCDIYGINRNEATFSKLVHA